MKKYETIFILDEARHADGGNAFTESLKSLVEEMGGEILETEEMGHRQFAHPIKKKPSGIYWDIVINLPVNKVNDLKEKFRLDQSVLRLEIFIYDRPEKVDKIS